MSGTVDAAVSRARAQSVVFAPRPRRVDLLRLPKPEALRTVRLHVVRNQAFELVASALAPFLAFADYRADVTMSDYDDTISAVDAGGADVVFVWLDFDRYLERLEADEVAAWLVGRLGAIRATTDAPILVANAAGVSPRTDDANAALGLAVLAVPGVVLCDQSGVAADLGALYADDRSARVAATRLSDAACVETARRLGLVWLPAALEPRLKVVALDLDNTLYAGVLGEDGPSALDLDHGFRELQSHLVALGREGLLLAVVSKNEPEDVERMFEARPDFPLRPEHLSAVSVGWHAKADGIRDVADSLRVGLDSVLFVDDNPGEIAAVAAERPTVRALLASDPDLTRRALDYYPRLTGYARSSADALRASDLAAASARSELVWQSASEADYFRSLGVSMELSLDRADHADRLVELSRKTNQFNLALRRLSEPDVRRRIDDPGTPVVSVRLADRIADSGVVVALFARWEGAALRIDELCVSCRALGRKIEDAMVSEAIRGIGRAAGATPEGVVFDTAAGERNRPALDWLGRLAGRPVTGGESVALAWPFVSGSDAVAAGLVEVIWTNAI